MPRRQLNNIAGLGFQRNEEHRLMENIGSIPNGSDSQQLRLDHEDYLN